MESTESFYGGAKYPLEPSYGSPVVYGTPFASLGTSVDARTANQLKELSEHLNSGARTVEVSGHDPGVFESIPKEHLKELNRMAKLTGADLTFHAPMIDPTGITQHGWDRMNQQAAEAQLWSAVERSHDLSPKGNIPVTLHASTAQLPPAEMKLKEGGEEITKSVLLITPDGKQLHQIMEREKFFPREGEFVPGKPREFIPTKEIQEENEKFWTSQLDNLNYNSNFATARISQPLEKPDALKERELELNQTKYLMRVAENEGKQIPDEVKKQVELLSKQVKEGEEQFKEMREKIIDPHAGIFARNAYNQMSAVFDMAYKGTKEGSEERQKLDDFARLIASKNVAKLSTSTDRGDLKEFADLIEKGVNTFQQIKDVQVLRPLRDFAVEKSAETAAHLALKAYKKFGDTAPIISLENHPAQQTLLSTGQDLKDVVVRARKEFVKNAVKEGISESEAEQQAKKLIGATWDVGHINMLRRYGYDKADIVKETEKVAPYVKHVHLSDNFGYEHTELPMGMGNVPIKEIMSKLGKEGFKGKQVVEALSWWQHFSPGGKVNPAIIPAMQAMGSPIYPMQMSPMWNQYAGAMGGYFGGYGAINPDIHHSLYGAGFTNLPQELGGQIAGKESRFSGTPMA